MGTWNKNIHINSVSLGQAKENDIECGTNLCPDLILVMTLIPILGCSNPGPLSFESVLIPGYPALFLNSMLSSPMDEFLINLRQDRGEHNSSIVLARL